MGMHICWMNEWRMNESTQCSFVHMNVHSHSPYLWCRSVYVNEKMQKELTLPHKKYKNASIHMFGMYFFLSNVHIWNTQNQGKTPPVKYVEWDDKLIDNELFITYPFIRYWFSGMSIRNCYKLGHLNNRNLLCHCSGGKSLTLRCCRGYFVLKLVGKDLCQASLFDL